jgi:hypothetical protein
MTLATWTEPESAVGLGVWAVELRAAAEIASSLALTPFVPDTLRVYVGDRERGVVDEAATAAVVTAALLTGREVGLSPMATLRSIDVIRGTPALRANTARALVLARGHELWLVESTTTRCIMRGKRAGSQHVQESTWTIERARQLGIANRDQWRRQPQAMLQARATAEIARLVAPEALLGLPYVVEELGDETAAEDTAAEPTRPPARRARRSVRPVVDAQLPPDPDTPTPPPDEATPPPDRQDEPPPDMVNEAQLKALHSAMTYAGIEDRLDRLAYVSSIIGRDVTTSKELTRAEASRVLDALADQALGDPPEPSDPPEATT